MAIFGDFLRPVFAASRVHHISDLHYTSGPKFTILWGHVEEILLLNKFFSDCRYMPWLRRYSLIKLCDGAQMAIFGDFFASRICSEPQAAHFRPAF